MYNYIQLLIKAVKCLLRYFTLCKYIELIFNPSNRIKSIKIDNKDANWRQKIKLHQFYFINDNHNISILPKYLGNINTLSFQYNNNTYIINIQDRTLNGQEIFLDDISL